MASEPEGPNAKLDPRFAAKCDVCGQVEWSLVDGRHVLMRLEPGDTINVNDATGTSMRVMVCGRCGVYRLFDSEALQD